MESIYRKEANGLRDELDDLNGKVEDIAGSLFNLWSQTNGNLEANEPLAERLDSFNRYLQDYLWFDDEQAEMIKKYAAQSVEEEAALM